MRIRPFVPGDEAGLRLLLRECRAFYGEAPMTQPLEDRLVALVAAGRHVSAVMACDGAAPLGFATWTLLLPAGDGPSLFMKELFVSAAARGRGVGRALMRDLVRIARAEGCSRIDWTTDEGNAGARRFYAGLGVPELAEKRFFRVDAACFAAAVATDGARFAR